MVAHITLDLPTLKLQIEQFLRVDTGRTIFIILRLSSLSIGFTNRANNYLIIISCLTFDKTGVFVPVFDSLTLVVVDQRFYVQIVFAALVVFIYYIKVYLDIIDEFPKRQ